jgi:hypothetical protein
MSTDPHNNDARRFAETEEPRVSGARQALETPAVTLEADNLLRITTLADEFNDDQIRDDARSAAERIAEGRFSSLAWVSSSAASLRY